MNVPFELFSNYNNVIYYDDVHKYYVNGKECISVTTLIHKYVNEFNEDYWSDIKAKEYNLTQKEVIRMWRFINKKGTMKGSLIHNYAEYLFQNKVFEYPADKVIAEFGFDPIIEEYNITKKHVDNFYNDTKGKLIPIKLEGIFYDEDSLISGTADMLFYNIKKNEYQIWDYKTNKSFETTSMNRLKHPLNHLMESDIEIYSLQLSLYKFLIEKNTNIKIGKSYLVWVSHNNDNYKTIEIINRDAEVKKMYSKRLMEVKLKV